MRVVGKRLWNRVGESPRVRNADRIASPVRLQSYKALSGTVKPVLARDGESEPSSR
jgi:hypothetical protein